MCLWFFMLCFVLVQKNIPTVEGRSPCSRRTGLDGARLTPGGLQAVLRFLAGQSLPTSQQAQGSVSSWRAWRPGEDSGQELGPLRAALRPAAGLHGDRTEALWDPRGHLISIPETLSSIKEIPRGWKPCQDLGRTL